MQPDVVVVTRYCCSAKAEQVAEKLEAVFKELRRKVTIVQADIAELGYWDGMAVAILAATPLGFPTKTPVLASPLVYSFVRSEDVRELAGQVLQLVDKRHQQP